MIYNYLKRKILQNHQSHKNIGKPSENVFDIKIKTIDGVIINAWLIYPAPQPKKPKHVIFLHGNRINRKDLFEMANLDNIASICNFIILVPDYREFADSSGIFTKQSVCLDIDACFQFMYKTFFTDEIFLIGHSLGGGIALEYVKYIKQHGIDKENTFSNEIPFDDDTNKENMSHTIFNSCNSINDQQNKKFTFANEPKAFSDTINFFIDSKLEDNNSNNNSTDSENIDYPSEKNFLYFETDEEKINFISKVVIVSTFTSIFDMLESSRRWKFFKFFLPICKKWIANLLNYDNMINIKNIDKNKILIFHGENDAIINFKHGVKIADVIQAECNIISNTNHNDILLKNELWLKINHFFSQIN